MFNILGFSHHPSPAHQNNMGAAHQMGAMHENNMGGGNNGGIGDLSKQILAEKAATGGEDPCCQKQFCDNSHLMEGASSLENCQLGVELCNITTVLDGNGNKVGERPGDDPKKSWEDGNEGECGRRMSSEATPIHFTSKSDIQVSASQVPQLP